MRAGVLDSGRTFPAEAWRQGVCGLRTDSLCLLLTLRASAFNKHLSGVPGMVTVPDSQIHRGDNAGLILWSPQSWAESSGFSSPFCFSFPFEVAADSYATAEPTQRSHMPFNRSPRERCAERPGGTTPGRGHAAIHAQTPVTCTHVRVSVQ